MSENSSERMLVNFLDWRNKERCLNFRFSCIVLGLLACLLSLGNFSNRVFDN